ncbi:MAG: hypothetical protein ACLFUH_02235 [Bacteroidales bacterium]
MNKNNVLSASGTITKKEIVCSVKVKSSVESLVLESIDPFPDVDTKHKKRYKVPKYYYIGITPHHLDQDILISARNAERQVDTELHSAIGEINIDGETYRIIRLKNISGKTLEEVLTAYKQYGLELKTFEKNIHSPAIICTKKFFYLEEIDQGFFLDLDEEEKGYVEVPNKLNWEKFEKITGKVKPECKNPAFDGAIGNISKHGVSQDVIRIYHPELDKEKLLEIGKTYIKNLFL